MSRMITFNPYTPTQEEATKDLKGKKILQVMIFEDEERDTTLSITLEDDTVIMFCDNGEWWSNTHTKGE